VTATEYYAVGSALSTISADRVLSFYERGLAKSDNVDSYLAITRSMGLQYFSVGDYERGRSAFTQALAFSDRFKHVNESLRRPYNAYTYFAWAGQNYQVEIALRRLSSIRSRRDCISN
jgi:hypothetical protein